MKKRPFAVDPEPVHEFFGLTYASYLVVPRSVLQSMPPEWQEKLVSLLKEAEARMDRRYGFGKWGVEWPLGYVVMLRHNGTGKLVSPAKADPLNDYDRGRRNLLPDELEQKDTMCWVKGENFRCDCGGNVFRKLVEPPLRYRCNSCGATYEAEEAKG